MGTTQRPIETLRGTEQGAKGLDTQVAVANSKKVHNLGQLTMPATGTAARETKFTPLRQPSGMMDEEQMEISLGHF